MNQLKMILVIFMLMTTISCSSNPKIEHPDLVILSIPTMPKFTREMLDCREPEKLTLCILIKEREETLKFHIKTVEILISIHNESLQ